MAVTTKVRLSIFFEVCERVHTFSTYVKVFEKLTFLTPPPDTHTYVCVSGG